MKKFNLLLVMMLLASGYHTLANACCAITINRSAYMQEERATGSFKGIATGGSIDVKVTMGNKESIRLEGDADAIADLTTEINNGVLIIKPISKWNEWMRKYRNVTVTAYITAKKLSSITRSGSGDLEVQNTISGSELVATLSGSGSITGVLNVKSFTGVLSGSGSLNVTGKSEKANVTLSGSGQFKGRSLTVSDISVQISGSANAYVNATKSIEAVISGSGSILYSGSPTLQKTILGSGSVKKI